MAIRIHWESDCGHKGKMITAQWSLAGQVQAALRDHDRKFKHCHMADIEKLETDEDKKRQEIESRIVHGEVC